nr:hypothetical protein [uncultured Draconibacterium sp.]
MILVKFNSKGSGCPEGIPLGAWAIAIAETNSRNVIMPDFFNMRYKVYCSY